MKQPETVSPTERKDKEVLLQNKATYTIMQLEIKCQKMKLEEQKALDDYKEENLLPIIWGM